MTKVLGHRVNAVLCSPYLIFAKSITGSSGPRFSFVKNHFPEKATHWAPSTLLRSTDKVSVPSLQSFPKVLGFTMQSLHEDSDFADRRQANMVSKRAFAGFCPHDGCASSEISQSQAEMAGRTQETAQETWMNERQ